MKHVLGMAKSYLDLRGSKAGILQLDLLRLALAVAKLRSKGETAQGYLLILDERVRKRIVGWISKYGLADEVCVECSPLPKDALAALVSEKRRNTAGMLEGSKGASTSRKSVARMGKALGEARLKALISRKEPMVKQIYDKLRFPLGVDWDFCGVKP